MADGSLFAPKYVETSSSSFPQCPGGAWFSGNRGADACTPPFIKYRPDSGREAGRRRNKPLGYASLVKNWRGIPSNGHDPEPCGRGSTPLSRED